MTRGRRGAALALLLYASPWFAQDLLQNLLRGDSAARAGILTQAGIPHTIRSGDFKLLVVPSLELDWNNNVNGSSSAPQQDFILRPLMQFAGTYPVTKYNILSLTAGIGYDEYLEHPRYNTLRLDSGSQRCFDVLLKDFRIKFHDDAQCTRDSGGQGLVSGMALYGGLSNSAGMSGTWDLHDLVWRLGFDHQNHVLASGLFGFLNRPSENSVASAGFHLRPNLTTGVEGSASFTADSEKVLNNLQIISAGVDADLELDSYFRIQPRAGSVRYDFDYSSQAADVFSENPVEGLVGAPAGPHIRTGNLNSWCAGLTASHQITEWVNYAANVSHEIDGGVQSDAIEVTGVGSMFNWSSCAS